MDVCGIVYCKGIYRGSGHMSVCIGNMHIGACIGDNACEGMCGRPCLGGYV